MEGCSAAFLWAFPKEGVGGKACRDQAGMSLLSPGWGVTGRWWMQCRMERVKTASWEANGCIWGLPSELETDEKLLQRWHHQLPKGESPPVTKFYFNAFLFTKKVIFLVSNSLWNLQDKVESPVSNSAFQVAFQSLSFETGNRKFSLFHLSLLLRAVRWLMSWNLASGFSAFSPFYFPFVFSNCRKVIK